MHTPTFSRRGFIETVAMVGASVPFLAGCNRDSTRTNYQIGAYTRAWGRRDYRAALDGMVATGYKFAGISVHDKGRVIDRNSPFEAAVELGNEVKSRSLKIVTLSAGGFDTSAPVEQGVAQFRRLVDLATLCDAPSIQINDPGKSELDETFYKVLAEGCDYAAEKRVAVNVHPHGSSGAHIRVQIRKVGHRNLGLLYDPGNVGFYSHGEIDPAEDASALDGVVYGVSIKDYRLPRTVNLTPGTGLVDFPRLMARLHHGGFTRGPLVVECLDQGEIDFVNSEARKAREFVESLVHSL